MQSINWTGLSDTYEPTYSLYPEESIQASETLTTYFSNENLNQMLCQDILWQANKTWNQHSGWEFVYKIGLVSIDIENLRLSYDIIIRDANSKTKLLEMKIQNLAYSYFCEERIDEIVLYFIPKNITYPDDTVIIDDDFWIDTNFKIDIKEWNINGGLVWSATVDFNFLEATDRWKFTDKYCEFLLFKPFFFSSTQIILE